MMPFPAERPPIHLVVTDVDGTLLNSRHELSARNEAVIREVIARGVQFVLATGKTIVSAEAVIKRLGLATPGVYVQGLLVCDPARNILYERQLDPEIVRATITLARSGGAELAAYSRDRILVSARNPVTDGLIVYHEPVPEEIGPLDNLLREPINKLIFFADEQQIAALRRDLEAALDSAATLVQAVPGVLEVLPPGASKGEGVRWLLDHLGVSPQHVLAIGDAENDVEMLRLAGIGAAVANARPEAKAAADVVVASNDQDGVADALERFVLGRPG
ncbi:MAG: Cof-type HAD-IIB family hydrolase [Anaerolineae bacterium]